MQARNEQYSRSLYSPLEGVGDLSAYMTTQWYVTLPVVRTRQDRSKKTHTHTHAPTHPRTHPPTHPPTHARTHARTQARRHARTHARTHLCTHAHTSSSLVRVCVYQKHRHIVEWSYSCWIDSCLTLASPVRGPRPAYLHSDEKCVIKQQRIYDA